MSSATNQSNDTASAFPISGRWREGAGCLLLASLALFGLIVTGVVLWFALPHPDFRPIGMTTDFPPASDPYQRRAEQIYFIVNTGKEIIVLSSNPPRPYTLPCRMKWDSDRNIFTDPCFGTQFNLDGSYRNGPAFRNMDSHPFQIIDGEIWVDTNRIILGEPLETD